MSWLLYGSAAVGAAVLSIVIVFIIRAKQPAKAT
jgi:hypothetical protein